MLCQHEETAVQIAHGYAKASGKPMVAILHNLVGLLAFQHGDLLRLHRPRADLHRRRDRADGRDQAPSAHRLDTHRAGPGRGGARVHEVGLSAAHDRRRARGLLARLLGDDDPAAGSGLHVLRRVAAGAAARPRGGDAAAGRCQGADAHGARAGGARRSRRPDRRSREARHHRRVRGTRTRGLPRARGARRDRRHPGLRRRQPLELPDRGTRST